jgi:membrane associated rhomboid family serine protease
MVKNNFLNKKFKYTYSNAVSYLILINIVVYMLVNYSNFRINGYPLVLCLGLVPGCINMGWVWQFFTYLFVHNSFTHLFFNMFGLYIFGKTIERELGTREFLLFYFVCGVLGGVISYFFYLLQGSYAVIVVGASGSLYALLLLSAVLFPYAKVLLFFFIPLRMPYAVMLYIAIELFDQVVGLNGGVAHLIHLSSIAIAWLYCLIRFRMNPIKIWRSCR